ncbi:hypothetical protein V6N13_113303 [Hibiscus sabdariffa]|uniref:Uncharacterized protein n=1 Tax=Hibiscus sabdariffa TaxID=183260 RepID=A0ABR2CU98_9ROSI
MIFLVDQTRDFKEGRNGSKHGIEEQRRKREGKDGESEGKLGGKERRFRRYGGPRERLDVHMKQWQDIQASPSPAGPVNGRHVYIPFNVCFDASLIIYVNGRIYKQCEDSALKYQNIQYETIFLLNHPHHKIICEEQMYHKFYRCLVVQRFEPSMGAQEAYVATGAGKKA